MEKRRFGTRSSNCFVSVDFPEPEGAEMMKMLVIRRFERLLADLLDGRLGSERQAP